ncbi:MAG: tRNA 5-hydroxyuridine modification protein YegQ [Methylohalobius sp. ZOD2]
MSSIELLSPAGTLKHLHYAFAYGADAVYAGLPRYSLRVRNNDFDLDHLQVGIETAHARGKKFYLAANVLPHNSKLKTFLKDFESIIPMGPDALIMADPGLILLIREKWPEMPIHLSVQANTMNHAAVRFWQQLGIERVILSRELSLTEIAEIRQACPDMELEVFVHGALCIAYSGRCLLSGYFNHRDPNQGTCTNACRWEYKVQPAQAGGVERHPAGEEDYLLEDPSRPGESMPIQEDEHGTYIMNSKDLRAVEHVQRLVELGIDCLKIEGRTKSHYYVARTAQVYRRAIDDALAGRPFDPRLVGVLENLANRGYTDGFYKRHHSHEYQNYLQGASRSHRQQFVGEVEHCDPERGMVQILIKNKLRRGDRIEWVSPRGNRDQVVDYLEDLNGNPLDEAPGGGWRVRVPATDAGEFDLVARYL